MARRLIVIGAGPIGLEAALAAAERGLEVTVLEQDTVGASLRRWGSTRFFSPFAMNVSDRARAALGPDAPEDAAILSGPEHVERVLLPLSRAPALAGRVRTGVRVVSVGRSRQLKGDYAGHPLRAERSFRVLAATAAGEEALEAECVLDASGVYGQPTWAGVGGQPALGERRVGHRLLRHLGDLEAALERLDARTRVLLVGDGASAANAILLLARRAVERELRVTWAVRGANARPLVEVARDPLPERAAVLAAANALAERPPPFLEVLRRAQLEALEPAGSSLRVRFTTGREDIYQEVVALTGYRPELSFLSELQLDVSPVSEGAGRLCRALSDVTDCLNAPALGPADLVSGEPGFGLAGSKSYGRLGTFLLKTGIEQLEPLLSTLLARADGGR